LGISSIISVTELSFKTKEDILIAIDDVLESAIEILFNKENEPEETKRSSIKKSLEETPDQTVRFKFILPENNFDEIASIIISSIKIDNCADSDELLEQETVQRLIQQLREKMYGWIDNIVKQRCGKNLSDINYQCETTNKSEFIEKVKPLLSNDAGTISPILSYARIEGEILSEQLSNEQFILIDSEGIGHNLNALNTCHFGFFDFADYILLIEEAKQPFMTTREIIKDIFHKGYNNKLKIIFNKFDKDTSIDDIKKEIKNLKGKKNDSTGIKIDEKKAYYKSLSSNKKGNYLYVDIKSNKWFDYGSRGSIIDLCLIIDNAKSVKDALNILSVIKPDQSPKSFSPDKQSLIDSEVKIIDIHHVKSIALIQYLTSRKIKIKIAQSNIMEAYYSIKGKQYFALCFKNDKGGFELRNKLWKGASKPKTYTTIKGMKSDSLNIFEGFFDYLSALSYFNTTQAGNDTIVLNSLAFLDLIFPILANYKKLNLYLDNDHEGIKAANTIIKHHPDVKNQSLILFPDNKDFNEFLCSK